jgi:hypothetical protein
VRVVVREGALPQILFWYRHTGGGGSLPTPSLRGFFLHLKEKQFPFGFFLFFFPCGSGNKQESKRSGVGVCRFSAHSSKMLRQLKPHEQKLLKKVNLYDWKRENNVREIQILRRYRIQKREDYTKYAVRRLSPKF